MRLFLPAAFLCCFIVFYTGCKSPASSDETNKIDREYVLDSKMTGYTGVGGDIDGLRNPVLRAKKGERVRVLLVNGELMSHDIVFEKSGVKSIPIVQKGDTTSVVIEANEDDIYFCSIPGHRQVMNGRLEIVESFEVTVVDDGVSPRKNGRPLNLGFERGSLQDWKASGEAFGAKSVSFDPAPMYPDSMTLEQDGDYYVSSGGTNGYQLKGVLTSESFEVTHPWASFKVSGGAVEGARVELVLEDSSRPFFQISGPVIESHIRGPRQGVFRPVVVDLQPYIGRKMFIRLVDEDNGKVPEIHYIRDNRWAHVAFDNFRFHQDRPRYFNELRPEDIVILPARDYVPHSGLSGADAVKAMTVPEGFSVQLAASEPEILKPITFALDDRGRLWVVESQTYPERAEEGKGRDRILIFEDTDGNGTLDSKKVFIDGLNLVSGIEVGFGGVWVGAAPYFMFIPIDETGDKPAGKPEILLDGWGYEDTHETLNTFRWGPDGWLYGVHGVFTHSNVGKPGASDADRTRINAGVWRYHPAKHQFEVFAHGTSNPWGLDFNDYGHAFITACVIPHLYHMVQGGRYFRQGGKHFNEHTYDDIKTIADHVHWVGKAGPHAANFRSGSVGGGHAHAGAMFYLGNKNWGMDRNAIFMNNLHGHRVNMDMLSRSGSGYTASHGKDFILRNDTWSLWLNFHIAPSGSVFVIDWYDQNQCHNPNPDVHNKTLGRIFRISHKDDKWEPVDLSKKTNAELVALQLHENEFYVRHARRLLQERGVDKEVHEGLWKILKENPDITRKLRALWGLHVTKGISEQQLLELLSHNEEHIRAWAIQLLSEEKVSSDAQQRLEALSKNEGSALVRLYIASALQRMEPAQRWNIVKNLTAKDIDNSDPNIPLLVWYGFEPLLAIDAAKATAIAKESGMLNIAVYAEQRLQNKQ
ncbi:MAG: hypothetical protein KIT80_05865 [Chitinophagaceae bacterium]|nr:hypothetical protein [Chitinophagaceae bacterium]MCW5926419.1 hypothetical protein [Chitinophagaceae bacterium]